MPNRRRARGTPRCRRRRRPAPGRARPPAPRGQNSSPTARLTAPPIATSSMRTSPICQPSGARMLKRISSVRVNAAWPAAKEIAAGREPGEQDGRREQQPQQRRVGADQLDQRARRPRSRRPCRAGRASTFCPVLSAFERSTESVPSTTQKACCTPVRLAISTARPRPTAPRMLFCSHSECVLDVGAGALLGGGDGPGEARGLAAEQLVEPAAPLGRGGPVDVRRDLRHDEAQLLRPEGWGRARR